MRVLENGPDGFPSTFASLFADGLLTWDTLDIARSDYNQNAEVTYLADSEYKFPIPDDRYDIVLSANVIEHVRKIWVWMRELSRVCKCGGLVISINPVSWPYHEAPIDCWRAFPDGMRALYQPLKTVESFLAETRFDAFVQHCNAFSELRDNVWGARARDAPGIYSRVMCEPDLIRMLHDVGYRRVSVLGKDRQNAHPHITVLAEA